MAPDSAVADKGTCDAMTTIDPDFNRLRTTLLGGEPDRVPLIEVLVDHEIKEAFLDEPVGDVETDVRFWLNARYDYVNLGRRLLGFPPIWDQAKLDNHYEVQAQRPATPGARGPISSRRDFRAYPWMTPADIDFRILDRVERHLPDQIKVVRYLGPVFQMVWMLMGFETFVFALEDDPGLVKDMFDRIGELVRAEFDDAIARDSVGAVWYVDDVGFKSGTMVSPDVLREYQFPLIRDMAARCRERGVPFVYHTDGNIAEIIPELVDMGVNALHPLEPVAVDIYRIRREHGDGLCLCGNIELATVLATGTKDEVVEDVKAHIRGLAPGGGYCLGSSNSVTRDIPLENYHAMIDTVMEFGKYPIEV